MDNIHRRQTRILPHPQGDHLALRMPLLQVRADRSAATNCPHRIGDNDARFPKGGKVSRILIGDRR